MLEVALRGLVLRGMEVVLRGTQVISPARGLALHLHDHHFQHSALLFFGAFWTGSFPLFYALFCHHSSIEDVSTITAPSYIWTSALFKIRQIFQCTRKCFGQQGFHPIAFTLVELVEVQRSQFLLSACEGCHRCFTPLLGSLPLLVVPTTNPQCCNHTTLTATRLFPQTLFNLPFFPFLKLSLLFVF